MPLSQFVAIYRLTKVYTYDFKNFGPVPLGLNSHGSLSKMKRSIKARITCLFISKMTIMVYKREKKPAL